MIDGRARRFALQGAMVARVYAGYKAIQLRAKLGRPTEDALERQHEASAHSIYWLAVRLEGLPIKVCQFIGSRADVLPNAYVEILSQLQDRVPARPLPQLRKHVERELGRRFEDAFAEIDERPVASASLAQVHRARLHDGREVAVKIQYPDIERIVRNDLANFAFFIKVLARLERNLDLSVLIKEVSKYVPLELDFLNEARNATKMRELLRERRDVVVPEVVGELSSRRVLVSEFLPGARITDVEALRAMGVDPRAIARRLTDVFCEMILKHGFFHADPHPGNILVRPDGTLVLLDFGLAKDFPPGFREGMARLALAIMSGDRTETARSFRALGFRTRHDDDASLAKLGEAFLGWSLESGQAYADQALVDRFNRELPAAMKQNPLVEIPGDILLVSRVMGLLSGIGKQLDSDVDPGAALLPYLIG